MTHEPNDIRLHNVTSSNVEALGFCLDPEMAQRIDGAARAQPIGEMPTDTQTRGTMRIRFTGGRTYDYYDVPVALYALIANAPSIGAAVQAFKRGRFMGDFLRLEE